MSHNNLGDIPLWNSIVDLILLAWVCFIFANRAVWSIKACRVAKLKIGARAIHSSTMATLGFTLYLIYLYARTFYTGFNDSKCTLLGGIGVFCYFLANFGIWMFYWLRHGWLSHGGFSSNYHKRVQVIGLMLFLACLLVAGVLIFKYWHLVKNIHGTCSFADTHQLGHNLQDDSIIDICIIGMDLICSAFISLTFLIPIWKFVGRNKTSIGSNIPADPCKTWEIVWQKMLRRLALCSFITTFSTIICNAGYTFVIQTHGNKNIADIFIFADGVVSVTAVHYSMVMERRWSFISFSRRSFRRVQKENVEVITVWSLKGTEREQVCYDRLG